MAVKVGDQVGEYRLVRELGSGTFGTVYQAEHVLLGTQDEALISDFGILPLLAGIASTQSHRNADPYLTLMSAGDPS